MKEHILINSDRTVTVPASLRKIGVQYDHNVNTLTFDCPRYSDEIDLSGMKVYINYILANGTIGSYHATPVTIDEEDPTIMHFDWTITRNVTNAAGVLSCLVCIKQADESGTETNHWNSEVFKTLTVSAGMESEEIIEEEYSDLITQLLLQVGAVQTDYDSVEERIGEVQEDVGELKSDLIDNTKPSFELGNINTEGKNIDATNYCRSDFVYVEKSISAVFNASRYYSLGYYLYDEDKSFISNGGNLYEYENRDFSGYIRFTLKDGQKSTLTTDDIELLVADFEIRRNNLTDSIKDTKEKVNVISAEVDSVKESSVIYELNTDENYNLFAQDGCEYHTLILPDGTVRTNSSWTYVLSDYIEIDASKEYICNYLGVIHRKWNTDGTYITTTVTPFERTNFAFFDAEKNYVACDSASTAVSKKIPSNAKYIRVTLASEDVIPIARLVYGNYSSKPTFRIVDYKKTQKETYYRPNTGFENLNMVMFGDSITHGDLGITDDGISYVDYINDYLGSNVLNCGFGGSRMSTTGAGDTSPFAFCSLVDAIVDGDWSTQDAYATVNTSYVPHLEKLKSVEWNKIHAIGLMYGANDYMSNTPIGTEYNTDISKYDGACAYGLDKLLTKYPHLQVILFTPFYRQPTGVDVLTDDTDSATNTIGLHMYDYGESLKNVQKIVHCPVVDTYNEFNINRYNMKVYSWDGTHPRCNIANKRLGRLFAESIKRHIVPVN